MPDSLRRPSHLRPKAITAAAAPVTPREYRAGAFHHASWQAEAWYFHDTLGEFAEAVDWQARGMSRIRLVAAEIVPEGPQVLTEGAAADLMAQFAGGTPGHSAFLASITPHLQVPGEGWLIAERFSVMVPLAMADWNVYAYNGVQTRGDVWQVQVGDTRWRDLAADNLPIRIYRPDPQRPWLARSPAKAAIPIMRRIELIDKRIIAMMVSRLAMNGLLLIPQEGTFDVPAQYAEAPDPFVAMLIDIAGKNIAEPGRASAGIPIPVKFTADLIEKWTILKPNDPLDEWLLKEREDELGRLGDTLSISRERVSGGTGQANHWTSWQLSEEEIRLSFAPLAELICQAITKVFLQPALMLTGQPLVGPNGGVITAWYDPSKLAARPDLSAAAKDLYDRGEITGAAYRREAGFIESDALDAPGELAPWIWRRVLSDPNLAAEAIKQLIGVTVAAPQAPVAGKGGGSAPGPGPARDETPATGLPSTRGVAPPAPDGEVPVTVAALVGSGSNGGRAAGNGWH